MDATGFDRDEIQPDMDLRRDLSVRSSRLPIIMDAAEHHFGITIELEDFLHVRTVRDIARRITTIAARQEGLGDNLAARAADTGAAPAGIPEPSADEARLKRLVFGLAPVQPAAFLPVELSPGETVLLLSPNQDDALARSAGDLLRQEYGVDTVALPFLPEPLGREKRATTFDRRGIRGPQPPSRGWSSPCRKAGRNGWPAWRMFRGSSPDSFSS